MIYALGHVSGAHFNPAVSFGFALTRHFPWRNVARLLGGAGDGGDPRGPPPPRLARRRRERRRHAAFRQRRQSFLWEVVLTFFLMLVVMAVATDTRAVGEAAALAVGGTVGLCALVGGPISGASMNPARSLGPALVSGELGSLWIYLLAPLLGASLGALAYQYLRGLSSSPAPLR